MLFILKSVLRNPKDPEHSFYEDRVKIYPFDIWMEGDHPEFEMCADQFEEEFLPLLTDDCRTYYDNGAIRFSTALPYEVEVELLEVLRAKWREIKEASYEFDETFGY